MTRIQVPQTRQNHTRIQRPFVFVLLPLLFIFLILSGIQLVRSPGLLTLSLALLSIALLVMAPLVRTSALRVQDRVIRLEERLRMAAILPEDLRVRALDLNVGQYVALRFAGDAELSSFVRQALEENLTSKQIKDRIVDWRPDYDRV